jgi:hypothetical protein
LRPDPCRHYNRQEDRTTGWNGVQISNDAPIEIGIIQSKRSAARQPLKRNRTLLNTPTASEIHALRAAQSREAGGNWSIQRTTGLDCIEHGWLTEDYFLTDLGKRILAQMDLERRVNPAKQIVL